MVLAIIFILFLLFLIFIYALRAKEPVGQDLVQRETITVKGLEYYETFELRGIHFPETKAFINRFCKEKDLVTIKPEPDNPVNPEALGVYHDDVRIGYIPDYDINEVRELINKEHISAINSIFWSGDYLDVQLIIAYK